MNEDPAMTTPWSGKTVLITGVCGTVGGELLRQIISMGPEEVIGIDNNESGLYYLRESYSSRKNVHLYVADVRERDQLMMRLRGVDVVMHAAAFKHVILCEHSPWSAVQNNILGTQNVIDAALTNEVERVLFCSTDKAVNPTSVMGTSKLMCERLITAANAQRRGNRPVLACSRFGNVLGSRGSVMPIFAQQIEAGGPVRLTNPDMTRFIMTMEQAVKLVLDAVFWAHGGEVFVTKMPIVRIEDLARVMIEVLAPSHGRRAEDIELRVVGTRPGEKLYEELTTELEARRVVELEEHFVVLPGLESLYDSVSYEYAGAVTSKAHQPYNSARGEPMAGEDLRRYLVGHGLLDLEKGEVVGG